MNEDELIARFKVAEKEFYALSREVENYFYPLAKQAVEIGDIKTAWEILYRCPDTVTRAFIADLITQAERK